MRFETEATSNGRRRPKKLDKDRTARVARGPDDQRNRVAVAARAIVMVLIGICAGTLLATNMRMSVFVSVPVMHVLMSVVAMRIKGVRTGTALRSHR